MSDIRTKLAAYAPAFVEALEELEKRAGDLIDANARTSEQFCAELAVLLGERIDKLESGQLGAKADVVIELHKRIDDLVTTMASLSLFARQHAQGIEQLEKLFSGVRDIDARLEAPGINWAVFSHDHVRELVLAAREYQDAVYNECRDYDAVTEPSERLFMALKPFEAIK